MKLRPQNFFGLAAVTISLLGVVGVPAFADDSAAGPFSVQASLVTPKQISLGEPILIRYKIANASPQKVLTHLGVYGTEWYTLTMSDSHGIAVSLIPDLRPTNPQGDHSSKSGFFRGGASDVDYIPVTKRLFIRQPGRYILTMHITLPYVMNDALMEGTPEALAVASELTQTQDITFPILVTPTDPKHLRDTAEALRKAALNPLDGQLGRADMAALFSMPEAQAAASWKELAVKPSMSSDFVASELEDLHSSTGVDILVQMLDTPGLTCTPVKDRINRIYNAGTPVLREHIKTLARQRGLEMPEVAGVPAVMTAPNPSLGGTAF